MVKQDGLPKGYHPYNVINFCSNKLKNIQSLILFNKTDILLIGKGDCPKIWLRGVTKIDEKKFLISPIVKMNKSSDENFEVFLKKKSTIVISEKNVIIHAQERNKDEVEIIALDLRPIGLDIYGTMYALNVGNNVWQSNHAENLSSMLVIQT